MTCSTQVRLCLCIGALLCHGCDGDGELTADGADAGGDAIALDVSPADTLDGTGPDHTADSAPAPEAAPLRVVIDLRGDVNRDGVIDFDDPSDDADEDSWDASHGAIFLANIDDDDLSCPKVTDSLSDDELDACHDAANEVIDGDSDLDDLARLKTAPWPEAPDDALATIELGLPGAAAGTDPRSVARVFKRDGASFVVLSATDALSAADLRQGVELAIEGLDIVRDSAAWDGFLDVTLAVSYTDAGQPQTGSDTVRLRQAPLLTSHHLQAVDTVYVTSMSDPDAAKFRGEIDQARQAAAVPNQLAIGGFDHWTQDLFESGWMSMPAPGGTQKVINVFIRSPNIEAPGDPSPLRWAGRLVYQLRGADVAAVQQYDVRHPPHMDSLNSLGNLETIPPYSHNGQDYPLGRIIMGKVAGYYPDRSFTRLLESQKLQPPLWLDTSWLSVGHVDETISFAKASTPRGWLLLLNDPELARQMLQEASDAGHGAVELFKGKYWEDYWGQEYSATVTIDEVLADAEVMSESAKAAVEIKAQLALLKQETGITEDEIVRLPFLHFPIDGYSAAYQPGTVNGTVLADGHFAAPDPHGPEIDGVDIFKQQLTDALAQRGITVHFIEDWDLYHRLGGEVHCGTNALRALPSNTKWWESGR